MTKRGYVYTYRLSFSHRWLKSFIHAHHNPVYNQPIAEADNWYRSLVRINNFHWQDYPCDLTKFLLSVDRFTYYQSIKVECSYAENRTWDVACQVTDSFASAKNITEIFFSLLVYSYATFGTGWINLVSFSRKRFFN